jgi:hypothetical protein
MINLEDKKIFIYLSHILVLRQNNSVSLNNDGIKGIPKKLKF